MKCSLQNSAVRKWLCIVPLLLLFVTCFWWAESAYARPEDGYGYNMRPPSFSNYTEEEEPDNGAIGVDETGAFTFFQGNYVRQSSVGTAKNFALQTICEEGYLTERVVSCIRMVVDTAVEMFLERFEVMLNGYILGLIILAVTIFGAQILIGAVEKPGPAAFGLLLKIGGVLLFTNALGGFLQYIFPVMETMAGYAMSYIGSSDASPFLASCSEAGGFVDVSIWRRVDCILQRLFTGSNQTDGSGYAAGVLWVLLVAIFWTTFLGFFVAAVMFSVFLMIFLLVLRCVFVFLHAYCFLALLTVISPLFIPLFLFKLTEEYARKWLKQFMSMFVQPMVLFAYMAFVFAIIDGMFFKDEPYSLARIMGANWENPEVMRGLDEEVMEEKLEQYREERSYEEDDPEYAAYRRYLENHIEYMAIGNVLLNKEPIIRIEINLLHNLTSFSHGWGEAGEAVETVADVIDDKVQELLERALIPFDVVRIQPEGRTRWGFLMDLLRFFLVLLIFMPLLLKYTQDLPNLIRMLSGSIRPPAHLMPVEKQVVGTIGAVKGATKGAVRGAVTGFMTGGKKGAIFGAVVEGAKGAKSGYEKATDESGKGKGGGDSDASDENKHDVHAKSGKADRKVLHGDKGDKKGGGIKGLVTDVAIGAATRGKGGGAKGGGGMGGKGGPGMGGGGMGGGKP